MNIFRKRCAKVHENPTNNESKLTGRSDNKTMTKFSSYENEVRPGAVKAGVIFFPFAGDESVNFRYGSKI